ncbi:MAG TPA: hypothetical protein VK563_23650 [Puia sp.]|nr:hypothetical protein [Puia sp.]
MNTSTLLRLLIPVTLVFAACTKEKSMESGTRPSQGQLVRIQQGADPDLSNDTVYLISYNPSGQIVSLTDSINHDTLVASYDGSGNITTIAEHASYGPGTTAFLTYDDNSVLTQVSYNLAGSRENYYFEYTNGVVSKKSYYSDLGSGGSPILQGAYKYTVNAGNITDIQEYSQGGQLLNEWTATYGGQDNPWKMLCLFNNGNLLGMDPFLNYEAFFNKNTLATFTIAGKAATHIYTYNSLRLPTKLIVDDQLHDDIFTWTFGYN